MLLIGLATLTVAAAGMFATPARAVTESAEVGANAVSHCQGNLPVSETALRKRPLAIQNEGATSAFVTCSFSTQYDSNDIRQIGAFGVFFKNKGTTTQTVTCTGVAGFESNTTNVYVSESTTVAPGGESEIFFEPANNGGQGYYPLVNMSCNLPPGVGIADTLVFFSVDDA